jgi:RND family efflux transporter MFP subunit
MKIVKVLIKIILPLALLAAGVVGMKTMVASRPAPRKEVRENPGALAEVIAARREDRPVLVKGTGTVQTHREVSITPEVSGRITSIDPAFIAGGFFSEGDLLFEIEKIDYELALEKARSARAQAELELARQESNARVARQEWKRLSEVGAEEPNPLVLYEPQLKQAHASLASADTAIRKAQIDLERTRVFAPFDCRVRREQVDLGQYVRGGVSVGTVADSTTAEIVVPLSLDEVLRLTVPRAGSGEKGSPATVEINSGSRTYRWPGAVVRSLGEVDPRGRMTRLVVAVDDPYHLRESRPGGRPDLEVGLFVNVVFEGGTIKGAFPMPRRALRENSTLWIAADDDTLRVQPVKVVRREDGTVLIGEGLQEGDRIILTTLPGAAAGMKLRIVEKEASP